MFTISFSTLSKAQIENVSLGAGIGIAQIKANSPSISAINLHLFSDLTPSFSNVVKFRFSFNYLQKTTVIFPENRQNRYYPLLKSFGLKAVIRKPLQDIIFTEFAGGIVLINDKIYSDRNLWMGGIGFDAFIGLDFKKNSKGVEVLGGIEYAGSYSSTNANYYSISISIKYCF